MKMAAKLLERLESLVECGGVKAALIEVVNHKIYGPIDIPGIVIFSCYDKMISELAFQLSDEIKFIPNESELMTGFKIANVGSEFIIEINDDRNVNILMPLYGRRFDKFTIYMIKYNASLIFLDVDIIEYNGILKIIPQGIMFASKRTFLDETRESLDLSKVTFLANWDRAINQCPNLAGVISDNTKLQTNAKIINEPDLSKHEEIYRSQFRISGMRTKSSRN